MAGVVLASGVALGQDAALTLRMRGGVEPPKGVVIAVDRDGVTIQGEAKVERLSWDRVAEVRGEKAATAREFGALADRAWRARTRLERGDFVAAEPLFEALSQECAGREGPTAAMAAEGLLRCRLRRGVQTGAVSPWLDWLYAAGDETLTVSMEVIIPPGSPPLVDGATGLCPGVPPIWLRLPSVEAWAHEFQEAEREPRGRRTLSTNGEKQKAGGVEEGVDSKALASKAERMERLYGMAAAFECGLIGDVSIKDVPMRDPDPGVAIVAQIVAARAGTAEVRREARRLLTERVAQRQSQWLEAWLRVGIGRSLLREDSIEERLLGVGQMLHVPARLRGAATYLAGVALAAGAMQESGTNAAAAWNLKKELMESLPGHPALDLEAIRSLRPPRTGRTGVKTGAAGGGSVDGIVRQGVPTGMPEEAK